MQVDVNGTRLWFDVDGAALVADGDAMRRASDSYWQLIEEFVTGKA
jgi:hypothetical protein